MATGKRPPVELDERSVQNALFAIGQPESWEELVKVGTAVKSAIGENGRAMFVEWAENSHWGKSNPERKERHNFSSNFNGFNTQKVGAGTLIYLANERTGGEFSRQNAKGDFQQTPEYLARQQARRAEIAAKQAEADRRLADRNAQTVQNIQAWFAPNALRANPSHPYLRKKGFDSVPPQMTYYKNRVQIPLYDKDGNIVAAQAIHGNPPEGMPQKQVYGSFKGASFVVGDINQSQNGVIMAEGLATAYSLNKATGLPVIMAVSSSNYDDVAAVYREKLPEGTPFIIAADNDKNQVGLKAAQKAAEVYGKDAVIQVVQFDDATIKRFEKETGKTPTDYNDLALYGSYTAVKAQIDEAIKTHKQQQAEAVSNQPPTPQQEKNIMAENVNFDNLSQTKQMRESEFHQMLDVAVQNGSLNEAVNRLNERFNNDFLDNAPANLSASYEMSQRIKNSLPENEQTAAAHKVLSDIENRMNSSDDGLVLEIANRAEILAKTWQPEIVEEKISQQQENVQEGQKQAHTEQHQAQVIEAPAAVETSAINETASEKETELQHFRENNAQVHENAEAQAEAAQEFVADIQEMQTSLSVDEPPEMPPPATDEEIMQQMQQSQRFEDFTEAVQTAEPVEAAKEEKPEVEPQAAQQTPEKPQEQPKQAEADEPVVNEDGTNSVERAEKRVQSVKEEQPKPQDMTQEEYQQRIYEAYQNGTLQKDFDKLTQKMETVKTAETFRDQFSEFSRMRNAIMELDAREQTSFKEQDGVKWARLTAAMGAGVAIAAEKSEKDNIFQAAYEDGKKRAYEFKDSEAAPKVEEPKQSQPETEKVQPYTITAEEALNNLNRAKAAEDEAALLRRNQAQQPEVEPQKAQQTAEKPQEQPKVEEPKQSPEKPLSVEQPQITIPREVTETFLVNRDRTELLNERTGETQIYINSEKNQLKTKHQDFETVEAMIKIAEKNQWNSITVKGTPEFRKLAWEMASIQGIEVKGYKPTKQEIEIMEARKARIDELKATNRIEGSKIQTQKEEQPQQKQSFRLPETQTDTEARQVKNKTDLPSMYYEPMNAAYGAGTVANFGSKVHPLNENKPNAKLTPYIELETASGNRHVVWGATLKELISQNNIDVGDRVALRVSGTDGNRKLWEIQDLVQAPKENQTQKQAETNNRQDTVKNIAAAAMVLATAAEAAKRGQNITAYKPVEQTKIQANQGESETQKQAQNQSKPRVVSQ